MADTRLFPPGRRDRPPSPAHRIADAILNLFYPGFCFICESAVSRAQDFGVCRNCWEKALQLRIQEPFCPSCGIPFAGLGEGNGHLCGKCTVRLPPYAGARAFGCYRSELSLIIQALKFDGRKDLADLLAPLLAAAFLESWHTTEIDLLVPVPLHVKRRRERGYNQAAVLGDRLGRLLGLPCCAGALTRVRSTVPQVGLTDLEREHNVQTAFRCAQPASIRGKRVLLIDDVMTTGSTVASAAKALMEGGALRVSVLTVARAVAGWE